MTAFAELMDRFQSLEFYAQELFARDAGAILQFEEMGRMELALMAATED